MNKQKILFISHSTKDKAFAEIIIELAVACAIPKDVIFCSSERDTGVRENIPREIARALKSSKLDILILSNNYNDSPYCLNEEGIIWHKHYNDSRKHKLLVISLPEILNNDIATLADPSQIQYRLAEKNFAKDFANAFIQMLQELNLADEPSGFNAIKTVFAGRIEAYVKQLPITSNLQGVSQEESSFLISAQKNIRKAFSDAYLKKHEIPLVFYRDYLREIKLTALEPGEMEVWTKTDFTIVNLSNQLYEETFTSAFPRNDGGFETFDDTLFIDDIKCKCVRTELKKDDSAYITVVGPKIEASPGTMVHVVYTTIYKISPDKFFQSKLVKLPCATYTIKASIDKKFTTTMQQDYILRFQAIPFASYAESSDKNFVNYKVNNGFPVSGGYALGLSKN